MSCAVCSAGERRGKALPLLTTVLDGGKRPAYNSADLPTVPIVQKDRPRGRSGGYGEAKNRLSLSKMEARPSIA